MAALLPAAVYLVMVLLLVRRGIALRRALLLGAVGWGVLVVVITESLSLFEGFAAVPVALSWTVVLLAGGGILVRLRRKPRNAASFGPARPGFLTERASPIAGWLAAGAVVPLGGVLLVALLGAPNNGDSMSYHLPRVMHWIQNGSVDHYSSWIPRQLYQPPMAEFVVAHFQLLYGSDRLAGLVQWFSLAGSGLAASLIAARLGAGAAGQALAGVFVVTLPMGVLQGMTAQNDLVLAFWLTAGTSFALEAFREPRDTIAWTSVLPLAVCLGLAVLTKATGYLFGLPLFVGVVALALRRHGGRGLRVLLVCTVVVLLLNGGHYLRNTAAFGHPLMPEDLPFPYLNRALTPATLTSNVVRNLALQAATPFKVVNDGIVRSVEVLHEGMNLSVSDRRVTWRHTEFGVSTKWADENLASNPLHLVLILLAGLAVAFKRKVRWSGAPVLLGVGIGAAFLLFCVFLQWQPWHSRLHLPLLIATAPLVAVWLEGAASSRSAGAVGFVLLIVAAVVVVFNASHPMVGESGNLFATPRTAAYFTNRPGLRKAYGDLADRVSSSSCRRLGLMLRLEDWEYPLWILLDDFREGRGRIVHVPPPGEASSPSYVTEEPTVVCRIVCTLPDCEELMGEDGWQRGWRTGPLQLWRREGPGRTAGYRSQDEEVSPFAPGIS